MPTIIVPEADTMIVDISPEEATWRARTTSAHHWRQRVV
jgi:hypothetical protein